MKNLTPHPIKLNDGTIFPPTMDGENKLVARVDSSYKGEGLLRNVVFGEPLIAVIAPDGKVVETRPLPPVSPDVVYIVSGMMAKAALRSDFYAPATGHPDAVRNDKGQVVSVPFLVQE